MLTLRRGLVPICLTLGALLSASPLLADAPGAPVMQASMPQTIVLQHVIPADVVKMLHWNLLSHLPAGVTQIVPVPLQNALLVTATPAGFAKVGEMVKVLDVAPHQVQVKFALAYASDAQLKAAGLGSDQYAVGLPAVRFLQTLTKQGAIAESLDMTTTSNVKAGIQLRGGSAFSSTFAVTPRVNSDRSLMLVLDAAVPGGSVNHEVHTVQNDDTLAIVKPPACPGEAEKSMVLFVTPMLK